MMRAALAGLGAVLCGLAALTAYGLAGAGETLPGEGYHLAWLVVGVGELVGLWALRLADGAR